ncbi:MAG: cytochrome P450, partial [Gammaproteobacteria bacterium]
MDSRLSPLPPIAGEELPHVGAGLRFLDAPTDYLAELRARHGDTFFVDLFGFPLLVIFSARGLQSLYQLPEEDASFGLATFDMIGFKTPTELFADVDPALFRDLLSPALLPAYLATMDAVVEDEFRRWGEYGEIDLFDAIRTLEQRAGFALWIAPLAAAEPWWQTLKRHLDVMDQATAFVQPQAALATIASGKAAERAALAAIGVLLPQILAAHDASPHRGSATADHLRERFAGPDPALAARKLLHNTVNLNQGFLSNLYAAIAWTIGELLLRPPLRDALTAEASAARTQFGEGFRLSLAALETLQRHDEVFMESTRIAQRSLTLRKVLREIDFDAGDAVYRVQPGVYIATMLSVTNTQTAELARFDPAHYRGRELRPELLEKGRESVSTFGHGRHACPAQRFSRCMARIVISRLLERFTLEPLFDSLVPSVRQMGGVSRPQATTRIRYRRRDTAPSRGD